MPVRQPKNTSLSDLLQLPEPAPPVHRNPQRVTAQQPPATDEWWTTWMSFALLKIGRNTLYERQRDLSLNFHQHFQLGGTRNLYRDSAVRAWADRIAASGK